MPIRDYDGSAYSTVSKVFDYDGIAMRQIKAAYDYDGSAYRLLYQNIVQLENLSASMAGMGSPPVTYGSIGVLSATSWDLTNRNSVTFTLSQANAEVYYWTSPAGTVHSLTRTAYLRLAGASPAVDILIYQGSTVPQTFTLNLSAYSNTQKSIVKLYGVLIYSISTVTNSAYRATSGWALSNASAQ